MTFSFLKWALHSLLKACNMTCSITNQKTDKVKFGRARAAMGSRIFAHGPFPWCKSPGPKHADLPPWSPTGWQGCPSSFLLALQSCPALAVACLLHHPDKKALFPGNQANTCQGNRFFFGISWQLKLWLLLHVDAWQHVNVSEPAERDANTKPDSDEELTVLSGQQTPEFWLCSYICPWFLKGCFSF